jgi:hypothetical protein
VIRPSAGGERFVVALRSGVGRPPLVALVRRFATIVLLPLAALATVPSAQAWGCQGHQIIALLAERHLNDRAQRNAVYLLSTAPMDLNLTRYCPRTGDPFADASTWADDVRRARPETAPRHFIDIPRGAAKTDPSKYCPPASGCVISALAAERRILGDRSLPPELRAEALRFAIHFVGDIHQPLHASTNNDLGGNCVPVTFFGHVPTPSAPKSTLFIPNLHEVWDVEIIERFSAGRSVWDVAKELDQKFSTPISRWQAQPADFAAWAWESHELAETIAYGRLPHPLPIKTPRPMKACSANGDVADRAKMPAIDENLAEDYLEAATPVVQEQLAKAGARLAAFLNSLWD